MTPSREEEKGNKGGGYLYFFLAILRENFPLKFSFFTFETNIIFT